MGTKFNDYLKSDEANEPEVLAARAFYGPRYALASQLIELRTKHGLSQSELSRRTGVNQAEISRMERGEGNPTERTLLRLAEALNVELRFVERNVVPEAS